MVKSFVSVFWIRNEIGLELTSRSILKSNYSKINFENFIFKCVNFQTTCHVPKRIYSGRSVYDCLTSRTLYLLLYNLFDIVINSDGK